VNSLHNESNVKSAWSGDDALMRLFELAVLLGEHMERGLVERRLTRARAAVIWQLHQQGPVTQRALSQLLRVSPRNVTGLVDALQADGFVARDPHPTDRRATLLTLTGQGTAAAQALDADYREGARYLFGELPDADLHTFLSTLDHVLERLRAASSSIGGDQAATGRPASRHSGKPSSNR